MMMTEETQSLLIHLKELQRRSESHHMHIESFFLNEEEQSMAETMIPSSDLVRYEGGYQDALKKKVIFLKDREDDLLDIVCLASKVDQRFCSISHRDILGALMSLQIDRHSFGDFWIDEDRIYLYSDEHMARFLCKELIRISSLSVHFEQIAEHPAQQFHYRTFEEVIASQRADAIVAALAHVSRSEAKEMIRLGRIQIDHCPLVHADEVCDNDVTISIRGIGRFRFLGVLRTTRKDRIVAEFQQSL
ncbi:MAG: RNA-binding protein [Erysipelotrichia bacterium]|nr:RNA-binding protein [Erysipelotrichia bacterium]